ncbi:MAG: ribonuclease J [Clostridia bacterium]|nr:ribonuclease J [Clostridia bacterium]
MKNKNNVRRNAKEKTSHERYNRDEDKMAKKKVKENINKEKNVNKEKNGKNIEKRERVNNGRTVKDVKKANTVSTKNPDLKFEFKKPNLKIIPLGGLEEIGKNITVFEYDDEIVLVDCGLEFPEDNMLGVDLVIPDVTYLVKNQNKIKGLVITHGHEDHIGSIPYVLKQVNMPIYATRLTVGLIQNKLEEHKLVRSTKLITVDQGQTINFGKMQVEFIRSSHSIPDSVMLAIHTPVGTVMHTGDFKIDFTPIDDQLMDFGRIAEIGNQGVLALLSDSTNSERKGYTMSESSVGEVFDRLFMNCKKRIVVATFASNVHRVQQICNSAVKYGRKIAVCGRSMINMIETARNLGYIQVPDNTFIDIDMIKNYTDEQLTILTTGSQGEAMSALTRMAAGEHKKVVITPNDLVIISATAIPGNEKLVSKVIDKLMQIGAEVVYSALEDIHVSGHACQEEQKLIMSLVRPKYFLPVHGEYRQLRAHAETARKMGIPAENIFMLENGRVLELNENEAKLTTSVPSGKILVDGLGVGDVGNIVLRDRQHLSQDGLIIIVMTMDAASGEIVSGPDVISRGFVYVRESENLMDDVKNQIREEVRYFEERNITDWSTIKTALKDNLRDYIFQKTKRNPMILPIIMEV